MDNYIIKEGDVLGRHNGRKPIVVCRITATHVTYVVQGEKKEHTVTRLAFRHALWYGGIFLLERAS